MRLAVLDGALFAVMLGVSETCFIAEAVRIGANALELSLVASVPLLCGGVGSVTVLRGLQRVPRRRPWVAGCALAQAVALLGLATAVWLGGDTIALVLGILCGYHFFGQAAGTAWSSWYGDVVPSERRGRYFAGRTRIIHVVAFGSVLLGGLVLHGLEPEGLAASAHPPRTGAGFAVLFASAAVARLCSAGVLLIAPEPPFRGLPSAVRPLHWLVAGRGRNSWRLLLGGGLFHIGVYASAPYFVPYMLEACAIGYLGYMAALGAVVAAKAVSLPVWGHLVDRFGSHRVYALALFLSSWVPLPFLWSHTTPELCLAYGYSGLAWGGYEIAAFALMLDSSTRRTRPQRFAAQGLVNGTGQVGGSLFGAGLMASGGYALAFGTSFAARLAVAGLLPWLVRSVRSRTPEREGPLALRLVGFRAHGGLVHRPLLDASGGERPAEEDGRVGHAEQPRRHGEHGGGAGNRLG